MPLAPFFDTVGPLCRSVEDATRLSFTMAGAPVPDLSNATLNGRRLLILRNTAFDDVRPEPLRGFDRAIEQLKDGGAQIAEGEVKAVTEAMPLSGVLFAGQAYGLWKRQIEAAPHKMYRQILERFRAGARFSAPDYAEAMQKLLALRVEYERATAGYDAVLIPTSPILPPDAERLIQDEKYYVTENLLALRNTRIGNLMGLCALTLPTGEPACGIMALAGPGQEARLCRLGAAMETGLRRGGSS